MSEKIKFKDNDRSKTEIINSEGSMQSIKENIQLRGSEKTLSETVRSLSSVNVMNETINSKGSTQSLNKTMDLKGSEKALASRESDRDMNDTMKSKGSMKGQNDNVELHETDKVRSETVKSKASDQGMNEIVEFWGVGKGMDEAVPSNAKPQGIVKHEGSNENMKDLSEIGESKTRDLNEGMIETTEPTGNDQDLSNTFDSMESGQCRSKTMDFDESEQSLFDMVRCVICSVRFNTPKSLPCLHTFCQKCLANYIKKYVKRTDGRTLKSFRCPKCREIVNPVNAKADPALWAAQFPTNGFITHVMEIISLELEKICTPCQRQNRESSCAEVWCKQCRICLCKTCIDHHSTLFLDHETTPVDQTPRQPSFLMDEELHCSRHNQSKMMFCLDHNKLVCSVCVELEHQKCEQVLTTEEYAKELKNAEEVEKLVEEFVQTLESLEETINKNVQQYQYLNNRKYAILQKLKQMRKSISDHFDKIEEQLTNNLTLVHKEEQEKIRVHIEECKVTLYAVERSSVIVQTTAKYGSCSQFVASVAKARENSLHFTQKALEHSAKFESVDLTCKFNPEARAVSTTIPQLGEIQRTNERTDTLRQTPIPEIKPSEDKRPKSPTCSSMCSIL